MCYEMLVPQPAHSQQNYIHSSNAHAEDDRCVALSSNSRFAEVGIHDAHGHQVEEEVSPVQGRVWGGDLGLCLEGPPCRGGRGSTWGSDNNNINHNAFHSIGWMHAMAVCKGRVTRLNLGKVE